MLTADGPRVLEFNCRFGDPETQTILPRIEGDLAEALLAAATGDLGEVELGVAQSSAVTVVLAAEGYPESRDAGSAIEGLESAEAEGRSCSMPAPLPATGSSSRVVAGSSNVIGVGDTLEQARARAYEACERISFPGARYRRDIAAKAVNVAG